MRVVDRAEIIRLIVEPKHASIVQYGGHCCNNLSVKRRASSSIPFRERYSIESIRAAYIELRAQV